MGVAQLDGYLDTNTDFKASFGAHTETVTTDDEGYFTLVFEDEGDIENLNLTVTYESGDAADGLTGSTLGKDAADVGEDRHKTSDVQLSKPWSNKVVVKEAKPRGIAGDPVALEGCPVKIKAGKQEETKQTGSGGVTEIEEATLGRNHSFTIDFAGLDANKCSVHVEKEYLGDKEDVAEDVEKRSELTLKVDEPGTAVTITFTLGYQQVFVTGEGDEWGYAIALARKYADASKEAGKRWVLASQYDCTTTDGRADIGQVLDKNLFVYRAPRTADEAGKKKGRFNAMLQEDWDTLKQKHGEFDAVVFNNPHPGYGLHMCNVFGLAAGGGIRRLKGRYISVHTVGFKKDQDDQALTPQQIQNFRQRANKDTAAEQKDFVRTYLGYACNYGADTLEDARDFSPVSIADAFEYEGGGAIVGGNFADESRHYRSKKNTRGLLEALLRAYIALGPRVLKEGGRLYVNGSSKLAPFMGNKESEGKWKKHGTWYAVYKTNHTSTSFHPSLLSNNDFTLEGRAPPLDNAEVYEWKK